MTNSASRREFVGSTAALAAAWIGMDREAFARAVRAAVDAGRSAQTVSYRVLTSQQAADLDAIAAQIIPTDDDLPGAREARAVVFIDRALDTFNAGQRESIVDGLADLNRRVGERWPGTASFAEASDAQQRALLEEIEETPFFGRVRFGVVTGTFAHPSWGGNHDGAGWRILGFEPRFLWRPPFGAYDAEEIGQ